MTKNILNVHFVWFILYPYIMQKKLFRKFYIAVKYAIKVIIANKHINLNTL